MVLQVRGVLHGHLELNIRVMPVSSTVEAVLGAFFVEGMYSRISLLRFPRAKHQVTNKGLVEKFFRNLFCFHARHVAIHIPRDMHQSYGSVSYTHRVRLETGSDGLLGLFPVRFLDVFQTSGFHQHLVI